MANQTGAITSKHQGKLFKISTFFHQMIRTRQKSKFMRNGIPGSVNPGHLTEFKRSFGQIPVRENPKKPFQALGWDEDREARVMADTLRT